MTGQSATPAGETGTTSAADVVGRLVEYYRRASTRMQGLPMYNPRLEAEAVGFRERDGRRVGVIVTPWFMNLTVLPSARDLATWRKGAITRLDFPSGRYDFVVSEAEENGLIATCSLFSLMHDFADHETARAAALAAADALFESDAPRPPEPPKPSPVMSRRKLFGG
jgi:[NiFe] hydrogenase assembly HybE family chaperone